MGISVDNVSKSFGDFKAVDQVSIEIKTGSLVALLGPSGSGKSTLLRLIAGLEQPDRGRIYIIGRDTTYDSVQNRKIGFVFQHYALFKHLTIRQNIAFGLEIAKQPKNRIKNRVEELLELVQMTGLGDRYPSQLSGGQRQRVALARALALEPQVLLLDEPFGALDAKVRKDLRVWLRNLHDTVHVTTVFVTHDQEEAMEVSDELVVMNKGRVEQVGSPADLYDNPATPFVMSFIGPVNVLPSTAALFQRTGYRIDHSHVFLRPHDVIVELTPDDASVSAIVHRIIHLGWEIQAELTLNDGETFTVYLSREQFDRLDLRPNQQVYVKPKEAKSFAVQSV
ncbi:MAG: sulfate/molybdate ABC transporter ATP-binding protein [Cyanobacteria bacterium CRU_2_1]|nr:sulfate/molybdate ABC transporter ATP-binding protein [Cyanobacteria bacterium RU_5_0]NJR62190.1 sulfate/molybdate ABC transporter ATP-binding protein [Cyanobacteria bacterium CRU_2_1]